MDVEDHLTRFRPVSPPGALRDKVLAAYERRRRSRWPARALTAAALLLVLANVAIEARLSAAMVRSRPAPMSPPPREAAAGALQWLLAVPAGDNPAAAQSLIGLRLEMRRSSS